MKSDASASAKTVRSCYSPDRPANNSGFRYSPDEIYLGSTNIM